MFFYFYPTFFGYRLKSLGQLGTIRATSPKGLQVNIYNSDDSFEFERNPKVTKISPYYFAREFTRHVSCFQVRLAFKPDIDEPDDEDDEISPQTTRKPTATYDLSHIPLRLRQKFRDFFDTVKAERLPSNRATDHAIELKPDTEPPFMRIYNMSPAELKALDDYINEALHNGWIRESKSPTGVPILFVPKKNGEL